MELYRASDDSMKLSKDNKGTTKEFKKILTTLAKYLSCHEDVASVSLRPHLVSLVR